MAPEVLKISRTPAELRSALRAAGWPLYGPGCDVWGAACVAWELLYGAPLFSRDAPGGAEALEREIASDAPAPVPEATRAGAPVSESARAFLRARRPPRPSVLSGGVSPNFFRRTRTTTRRLG